MHRYIKSSVVSGDTMNFSYQDIGKILSAETLDSRIIDIDNFSFSQDFSFCDTDNDFYRSQFDDLITFGAILRGNVYVIPANLKFGIRAGNWDRFHRHQDFLLVRNGVSIREHYNYINEYSNLNITFTPFGYKCYLASEDLNRPFADVVKDMLVYAQYFNLMEE